MGLDGGRVRGNHIRGECQVGQSLAPRRGCERDGVAGPQTARAQGQEARVGMSAGPDHLGLIDLPLFNF